MESLESQENVSVALYDPSTTPWETIWPAISRLEDECFPGKGLGEEHLRQIFEGSENIVVVLNRDGELIGFTCGLPDPEDPSALYIETTEITPAHQGKKHVVTLMNLLEAEARKRNYRYISRDAEIANGYAEKIEKNYGDRIIESYDHESEFSMGGMQRYFKIAL